MYLIKFGDATFVAESLVRDGSDAFLTLRDVSAAVSVEDHLVRHSVVFPYAEFPRDKTILLQLPADLVVKVQS